MKRIVLFFILFIFSSLSIAHALNWAGPFVVWNGNVYEVTEEKVEEIDVGENIGEVKTTPNDMTGEYYGDASNAYPKGTKYYKLNDIPTKTAIAVEVKENQWQKAIYIGKAPFHWMDFFTKILPILIILMVVSVFGTRFIKEKNNLN